MPGKLPLGVNLGLAASSLRLDGVSSQSLRVLRELRSDLCDLFPSSSSLYLRFSERPPSDSDVRIFRKCESSQVHKFITDKTFRINET